MSEHDPGLDCTLETSADPAALSRQTACRYVGEMCRELSELASSAGEDTLAYLLDMAHLEAESLTLRG